mmetsp:Transcript_69390/g.206707  ORF Transcript_69390/g.206707 Transcript_69390/m.206707 type:complete len:293 (+) Transcript_69390:270-1148(+)
MGAVLLYVLGVVPPAPGKNVEQRVRCHVEEGHEAEADHAGHPRRHHGHHPRVADKPAALLILEERDLRQEHEGESPADQGDAAHADHLVERGGAMQEGHDATSLSQEVQRVVGRLDEARGAQHHLRVRVLAVAPEEAVEGRRKKAEAGHGQGGGSLLLRLHRGVLLLPLAHQTSNRVGDPPEGPGQGHDDRAHREAARVAEEARGEAPEHGAALHLLHARRLLRRGPVLGPHRAPPLDGHDEDLAAGALLDVPGPLAAVDAVDALDAQPVHALEPPSLRVLVYLAARFRGLD